MKDNLKWTKSKVFLISINCILCVAIVVSAMMIVIDKSRIKNGAVFTGGTLTISMCVTRGINYYLPLIISAIVAGYCSLKKKRETAQI